MNNASKYHPSESIIKANITRQLLHPFQVSNINNTNKSRQQILQSRICGKGELYQVSTNRLIENYCRHQGYDCQIYTEHKSCLIYNISSCTSKRLVANNNYHNQGPRQDGALVKLPNTTQSFFVKVDSLIKIQNQQIAIATETKLTTAKENHPLQSWHLEYISSKIIININDIIKPVCLVPVFRYYLKYRSMNQVFVNEFIDLYK